MPRYGATWSKLGACEEIADLLKRSVVLQGQTHQAGDYVVQTDQLRGTVRPFDAEEDFGRLCIVMDAEVERALPGDFHFLGDVVATGRKNSARTWSVDYIAHARCKSL